MRRGAPRRPGSAPSGLPRWAARCAACIFSGTTHDAEAVLTAPVPPLLAPPHPTGAGATRYRALLEGLAQQYCLVRVVLGADGSATDLEYVETNAAFRAAPGGALAVPGRRVSELAPVLQSAWLADHEDVVRTRRPRRLEHHEPVTGRWYDVQALPFDDDDPTLVALVFDDVTDRRRAEAE